MLSGDVSCIVFIDESPTRPTLIYQGVGVSLSLAQRDDSIRQRIKNRSYIKAFLRENISIGNTGKSEIDNIFNKIWKSHWNNFSLFPGVHDIFCYLKSKDISLAVISGNVFYVEISDILRKLNIYRKTDIFLDGRMTIADMYNVQNKYKIINNIKSNWQSTGNYWIEIKSKMIEKILNTGEKFKNVIYFTDDPMDYKAVYDKNVIFVGVLTGVGDKIEFSKITENIIPSVNDTYTILQKELFC